MNTPSAAASRSEHRTRPGIVARLVGLLSLWQIVFVPLANLVEFVPLRQTAADVNPPIETAQRWGQFTRVEPLQQAADFTGYLLASWAELTGQDQGWNMFTPAFPPNTVVPVVEFRFADGTADRLYSRFEPDLAKPRIRIPLIHDREFNHEANLFMLAWDCGPEAADQPELLAQLPGRVRDNDALLSRWLYWQWRRYGASHPARGSPDEVVLIIRHIPIPLPGEHGAPLRRPVFERPLARWLPGAHPEPGFLRLEAFNPATGRFVPVKAWPP